MLLPDGKYAVFWRATCSRTNRELTFRSHFSGYPDQAGMEHFVATYWRSLTLIEFEPWDQAVHGHRLLYPVPAQNINFNARKFELAQPDKRRVSVLITPSLNVRSLGVRSVLKGT